MARTHPYAPMHAVRHHPLAPWLERYRVNPSMARAEALKSYKELSDLSRDTDEFEAISSVHAFKAIKRNEYRAANGPGWIEDMAQMLHSLALWNSYDRKIYEFGPELTRELMETELHEVTCEDLRPPISNFYLAFDMDQPYILPSGQLLDGVLMTVVMNEETDAVREMLPKEEGWHDATVDLVIMARPGKYEMGISNPVITIPLKTNKQPIEEGFHEIMERYEKMYQEGRASMGRRRGPEITEAIGNMEDRFEQRRTMFADLYRLIFGALLYLSVYHDKGNEGWSKTAPKKFVDKLDGQKAEAERARNWLAEKGWSRATYFNIAAPSPSSEAGEGGSVATHWRRGHWRRSRVGPNRCERKLTWIRPMLINADIGPLQTKTQIVAVNHPQQA